jgi:Arc/MetJ-type ribon-helix-helix transcriptional regulator
MKSALEAKEAEIKEEADAYLSYVVEEWTSKNEVALKQQVKVDVLESFIGGLRTLFLEHNFNIPEEQANMVDALMDKVAGLEEDVKALSLKNVSVSEELDKANRLVAFKEVSEGMTELDVEKLKALVESKEFESAEEFKKGVALIKESYFKKEANVSDEQKEEVILEEKQEIPANIQAYSSMISKSSKK